MSSGLLNDLDMENSPLVPLTVEQYHQMIASSILSEGSPVELLEGFLVRKDRSTRGASPMTVGYLHAWVLDQLCELLADIRSRGCYLRIQQPITIPPASEPEPDAVLVCGRPADYQSRHPAASDVLCVFEVADTSLRFDRTTKARIYASGGIPLYVLINLQDRQVEVRRLAQPASGSYAEPAVLTRGDKLTLGTPGGAVVLSVADMLPQ